MSHGKWTPEQYSAITAETSNLLIAAAAGAGKTAVLVERITRKITTKESPLDIDKLLVVTFTKAAASQMRERIAKAINKLLEEQPESKGLQRQLTLLGKASITTIHSFCLEVIQSNFQTVDLEPGFKIADETESVLLKLEALEELFEQRYEEENYEEGFFKLLDSYGGSRDDRTLQEIVLSLYSFIQSHPWPMLWMQEAVNQLNLVDCVDFGTTKYAKILKQSISLELEGYLTQLKEAVEIINRAEGLLPYNEAFANDIAGILLLMKNCREDSTWDELFAAFQSIEFLKLGRCGKDVDKLKQEQVQDIRNKIKKRLNTLKTDIVYADSEGVIKELVYLYPMFDSLYRLVKDFDEIYRSKKKKKAMIDFNDLEHYCLKILTAQTEDGEIVPSEAAIAYRNKFEELYIDEYQDSNEVQEVILKMISRAPIGKPNIFMVGDIKQSIYRFRQAKPELFKSKYNTYKDQEGSPERKILLNKNFRSRKEVIAATNFVFKLLMNETIGELDYNDNEALNLGASYEQTSDLDIEAGGAVELNIIDMGSIAEASENTSEEEETEDIAIGEEEQEDMDSVRCEAVAAANRIKALISSKSEKSFMVFDEGEGTYRKLRFSDIVILMRSTKNWVDAFVEELTRHDIPVYADTGGGYLKTTEISIMLSLLQIIDNSIQDIPLLSVLRSPIGGFTPEELIDIRVMDKEASMFEAMEKLSLLEEEGSAKCREFLARLEGWRSKAMQLSTAELIWYLYNDTGYFSYASAMPGGMQRQANLKMLFEKARQFEETSLKGLFNFVSFIDKLRSSSGDMGSAKILGENANVVRIMSIHKSKGLEFPVVILAGTGKSFNLMDMNKSILLHQELGFGPDFVDYDKRISYGTAAKHALRYKIKLESLSEEMRILYVAFTRAKEKLIILGTVSNLKSSHLRWKNKASDDTGSGTNNHKLASYDVLKGKNYLDWICSALYKHRDGEPLRSLEEKQEIDENSYMIDDSSWSIKLISKQDILEAQKQVEKQDFLSEFAFMEDKQSEQSEYKEEIARRLQWEYPYKLMNALPVKITVSELKRSFDLGFDEQSVNMFVPTLVKKPMFLEEGRSMSAAEKGTIMHYVLQSIDITKSSKAELEQQLRAMVEKELLTEEQAKTVSMGKIRKLLESPLGRRMAASKLRREVPFNLEIACTEIYTDLDKERYGHHMIMLQGIIDCCFECEDGLVLIDYKTDFIQDSSDFIRQRYRVQMDCYTKALERITGKRVAERYIYLFYNGEILEM